MNSKTRKLIDDNIQNKIATDKMFLSAIGTLNHKITNHDYYQLNYNNDSNNNYDNAEYGKELINQRNEITKSAINNGLSKSIISKSIARFKKSDCLSLAQVKRFYNMITDNDYKYKTESKTKNKDNKNKITPAKLNATARFIKEFIYENNAIEYVLESIGCHDIKYSMGKQMYVCANYDGDNISAVNVFDDKFLNVRNWTRQKYFNDRGKADLITLVCYNLDCDFMEALRYLHELLGLKFELRPATMKRNDDEDEIDDDVLTELKPVDIEDVNPIDEGILDKYVPILYIGWWKEGIMPWSRKKFDIRYSVDENKIVIPLRYWKTGELIGISQRNFLFSLNGEPLKDELFNFLDIPKYTISKGYPKSMNLYGLYENYSDIQKAGYVVVFESEKSVLKRDSLVDYEGKTDGEFDRYSVGVALSGHSLSSEQIRILIGLDVDIIISMDNDVELRLVYNMCEQFYSDETFKKSVFYTHDEWGLLGEKDSIADLPNKDFKFIMSHKFLYDEIKHDEYMRERNR